MKERCYMKTLPKIEIALQEMRHEWNTIKDLDFEGDEKEVLARDMDEGIEDMVETLRSILGQFEDLDELKNDEYQAIETVVNKLISRYEQYEVTL
jgi:DNA-binding transcriptional regulator GbsR (MarR family)